MYMEIEQKLNEMHGAIVDLAEAMQHFVEHTDQRFDAVDRRLSQMATKDDVQDALLLAHERAMGTSKKVDLHVDAVVDTLADRSVITPADLHALHAMQPFPKLVKET